MEQKSKLKQRKPIWGFTYKIELTVLDTKANPLPKLHENPTACRDIMLENFASLSINHII